MGQYSETAKSGSRRVRSTHVAVPLLITHAVIIPQQPTTSMRSERTYFQKYGHNVQLQEQLM